MRSPKKGGIKLHERESSDILGSWSSLRRTVIADKLFERAVTKDGRTPERLGERDRAPHADNATSPLIIKGSGGRQALALQHEEPVSVSYTANQPTGILAQLFGGTLPSRSSSEDSQQQQSPAVTNARYAALEAKLDKIEEMVSRLVTGGLSLDNNDR